MRARIMWVLVVGGCQEFALVTDKRDVEPVATELAGPDFGFGDPPDWDSCRAGWIGDYTNLQPTHPDIVDDAIAPVDPRSLDWWARSDFQDFDASLDFGPQWWPIDDGLTGDPEHFAVRWRSWMRVWSATELELVFGAVGDAWMLIDEAPSVQVTGDVFEPEVVRVSLQPGQVPVDVRYGHRGGDSGFRWRVVSGDVSFCYPDFGG
ncbi:MAG: hypothetical protein ACI9K2_004065 [Myxococcota bacterium]|jgi:hypothetical protein